MRRLAALALLAPVLGCGGGEPSPAPPAPATTAAGAVPRVHGDEAARVVRRTTLHASPGGRVVARVGTRTEFGSPRVLPVIRRRGAWLGVIASQRPNGRLAWIRAGDTRPLSVPVRVAVDLSARTLRVVRRGRTVLRMAVGVGAADHPTPTGRFAVTDGLHARAGSPYGCCIVALSGHQPDVPQGWTGGDRLAVHGTTDAGSVGAAASAGCLRAREADLRRLMRLARLGALVDVRA